ncbi:hypothetical protein CF326_g488 [Tilletia indica]|nr:hypothetical protein CF326_g488 [Tilletia indica]
MPFFSRKRSHSSSIQSPDLPPTLPEDILDELTDNIGSVLSIHNTASDDDDDSNDALSSNYGTPKTRPNSFSSVGSNLTFVREEEDDQPPVDAEISTTTNPHRRASESMSANRSVPPRRPCPLSLTTTTTSDCPSSASPISPRRHRQGSLILAVDELDIKRQKRCSVPSFSGTYAGMHLNPRSSGSGDSYGWSFGISDREKYFARASFSYGCGKDSPMSPVLPFSPIASSSARPPHSA